MPGRTETGQYMDIQLVQNALSKQGIMRACYWLTPVIHIEALQERLI